LLYPVSDDMTSKFAHVGQNSIVVDQFGLVIYEVTSCRRSSSVDHEKKPKLHLANILKRCGYAVSRILPLVDAHELINLLGFHVTGIHNRSHRHESPVTVVHVYCLILSKEVASAG
jgi:hypothetical protein